MTRFLIVVCALLISGCHHPIPQKVVARVDNYTITQEEFDEAYRNSSHTPSSVQSRRYFLNNMINQKLILLDAEAHGLDRNKEFLRMVENFWQQSLLTMALKEKNKEGVDLDQWVTGLREKSKVEINEEYVQ
jgi:hypothetical protein